MTSFVIRRALPGDNQKLIELARRCPMLGQLEMYSDRYPDFFAMNRLQGETAHIYLAETPEGNVIGCAALTEKKAVRDGKPINILHIGDLRSDPSVRRSKIAAEMVDIYKKMLHSGDYDHGIFEMLEGNRAITNMNVAVAQEFNLSVEGKVNFYQLVPFRSYAASKQWSYRLATAADLPAIVANMQSSYGGLLAAPEFSVEWLENELMRHESFGLANLWVAVDRFGTVRASSGLWDQSSIRKTIATKFTRGMKNTVRFLALFGLVWRLPPIPSEGKALRYAFCRWPAARDNDVAALKGLCRFLLNRIRREQNYQFLSIGFQEGDPLSKALEGIAKVQERIEVYSHWVRDSEGDLAMRGAPPVRRFVDLALI